MSIAELVNAPIDVTIGGKNYKMQRMPIKEIFAPIQTQIINENKKLIDEAIVGLTPKEASEFRYSHSLTKAQLDSMAMEYISSPTGMSELLMTGLNKCQPVSEQEISDLILRADEDELSLIQSYLTGETPEVIKKKRKAMKLLEAVTPKL